MELKSIFDRQALASLRRWRLRLRDELREALADRDADASSDELARKRKAKEIRHLETSYETLSQEIAEQNCRRQCELMERYKGERKGTLKLLKEMSNWCWRRY